MTPSAPFTNGHEHKSWKQIFIALSIVLLILMPFISRDYGQSGDEWLQTEYGEHIWNYFFNGDKQALDYSNKSLQYSHQEYYGGFFDFSTTVLHKWMPSVSILTLRHFCNALFGALLMIFTGLLARRLSNKWAVGVVALLFIVFSPRIWGESMNNPKDIPFATGFIIGMYFLVALLQDMRRNMLRHAIGLAIGWGMAFGIRSAGGILLAGYFVIFTALYFYMNKPFREAITTDIKLRNKLLLHFAGAMFVGYLLGLSMWPWGLQSPISHPLESLQGMTNREINIQVLFEGMNYISNDIPWHYEFKWIAITNPLVILLGFALFIIMAVKVRRSYGNFAFILILFGALFPLLYMVYKNSTVYDTWRHVFFVYPFWVIAGAMGWDVMGTFVKNQKLKWLPYGIAIVGLLPAIIWTIRSHPNQTVYFNELTGGVKGAYGYYDTDYYQNSGRQAAEWIKQNVKPIPGRKVVVLSNLSSFWTYFKEDTSWIYSNYGRYQQRNQLDWDYYVTYSRYISPRLLQNDMWPPKNTIHIVKVDGVPLTIVLKRNCPEGQKDVANKQYEAAIQKYEACIKQGASDGDTYYNYAIALASTGRINEAVSSLLKAIEIEPDDMDYLQLLANIYQATNNQGELQKVVAEMQKISAAEQEYNAVSY